MRAVRTCLMLATAVLTIAWSASYLTGVCYAGQTFFFSLTDGYLIVPQHPGERLVCPEYGFWLQETWDDDLNCYFPSYVGSYAPYFAAPVVLIPLLPVLVVAWFALQLWWIRTQPRQRRERIKWIGTVAWNAAWWTGYFGEIIVGGNIGWHCAGLSAMIAPASIVHVAIDRPGRVPTLNPAKQRFHVIATATYLTLIAALLLYPFEPALGPVVAMLFVVAVVLLPSLLADVRGRAPAARGLDDTTGLIQRILKRRRRSALHIAAFAGAGFAAAVIFALILVSGELALCYAGPSLLFAFSDGALVIAIGKTGPTAWGESGWWTQSPMIDPMLGFPSQFGAPIRVIPLVLPFLALFATAVFPVAWVACTMDRDTKKSAKAVGVMISLVLALFWFRHHDKLSFRLALFGTVAIPTIMLLAADRLRRAHSDESDGYCAQCGYNLTGNTSGICPECGRRIPADVIIPPPQILAQGPVEVAENR